MTHEHRTLAELVRAYQDTTGESLATIATRAGLSKSKVFQVTHAVHFPRLDTIEKLAIGLKLPLAVVKQAAMTTFGLHDPVEIDMLAKFDQLPARDQRTVSAVIGALESAQSADPSERTTPHPRS